MKRDTAPGLVLEPIAKRPPPVPRIPKPFETAAMEALAIDGPARVLILPDVHIPFHVTAAIELAVKYGKRRTATHVLLNGDALDFYAISHWDNCPSSGPQLFEELNAGRDFLAYLRREFPRAPIIHKEGNHEERLGAYVWKNAGKLWGAFNLTLAGALDADPLRITYVGNRRLIRLGGLSVLHGHEHRFAISNPVNPARGLFNRAKCPALCGHFHQKSDHSEKLLDGKLVSTFSTGCLCELQPYYYPYNNHCNGFAFVEVDERGRFNVENFKVSEGRVWT
jgi:hypothetical protein